MRSAVAWLIARLSFTLAFPADNEETHSLRQRSPTAAPALQDPSKLKYEIVGIVGAYLFWLIGTVLLITLVGRRLRKRSQEPNMTMMRTIHTIEQVVEVPLVFESPAMKSMKTPTTPKSPSRISNMRPWGKKGHKSSGSTYSNSTMNSTQSHELHKAKDMDDLTKLYAAVMAHDERRAQEKHSNAPLPSSPVSRSPTSPGYPPEFAHLHNVSTPAQSEQPLPLGQALHHPMAPTPIDDSSTDARRSYYNPSIPSRSSSRTLHSTPLSFVSDSTARPETAASTKSRPARISVRGLPISQPIGSADLQNAHYYNDSIPLSPRIYNPGPAPPTPGKKRQVRASVEPISEYDNEPEQSEQPYHDQSEYHHHQQYYVQPHQAQPQTIAQTIHNRRVPPALALHSATFNSAASSNIPPAAATAHPFNTSKQQLPFRDVYGDTTLRSAPPTKTTFLDRPAGQSSGPKTGVVPSTPYSPYMPSTPMTPITPRRLMNKQELKAKRKEEKLMVLKEDDLVVGEDDMWGK